MEIGDVRVISYVCDKLRNTLQKTFARISRRYVFKNMASVICSTLQQFQDQGILESFDMNKTSIKMVWNTWSLWEKMYWYYKMKFGFGKKEYEVYSGLESFLLDQLFDENNSKDVCKIMEGVLLNYCDSNKKWWYELYPKKIVFVDIMISLSQGVDCVVMNVEI